jgi:hypothetical protein
MPSRAWNPSRRATLRSVVHERNQRKLSIVGDRCNDEDVRCFCAVHPPREIVHLQLPLTTYADTAPISDPVPLCRSQLNE